MTKREVLLPDLVWLVPVSLSIAATCATAQQLSIVVPLLMMSSAPWLLLAAGHHIADWLFATVGLVPVVGILYLDGLNASVFLATTALCLLASRASNPLQVALIALVGLVLPFVSIEGPGQFDPGSFYFAIGDLFGTAVGVLLGHTRRLYSQLREADVRLAAVAALEERAQLARDVHDLVAHSLTVAVLQIGGARGVLRRDPTRAETALKEAERVCRDSLDGIREVVGLLRSKDGHAAGAAVDLHRLVETYRAAGVVVHLEHDALVASLPLLTRGTLYRVVQEGLANAARYRRPGTDVAVRTALAGGWVELSITNDCLPDARETQARRPSGGYGLPGLREQVEAIGGSLTSGPESGRWHLECRLPQRDPQRAGRTNP